MLIYSQCNAFVKEQNYQSTIEMIYVRNFKKYFETMSSKWIKLNFIIIMKLKNKLTNIENKTKVWKNNELFVLWSKLFTLYDELTKK